MNKTKEITHKGIPLVRLLLTPTWKLRIMNQMEHAQKQYDEAVAAYHEAEEKCLSSCYEHNHASYWKGRRDALRVFLPKMKHTARRPAKMDTESSQKTRLRDAIDDAMEIKDDDE
jgi:hypothetical protein